MSVLKSNRESRFKRFFRAGVSLTWLLSVGICAPAICGEFNFPPVDTSGLTPGQASIAEATRSTCNALANMDLRNYPLQQDLLAACTAVLNLPQAYLGGAMQQIGTEEFAAEGTNATETTRGQVIQSRLSALRTGTGGFSMSGLQLRVDDHTLSAASLWPRGLPVEAHGGGPRTDFAANLAPADGSETSAFSDQRLGLFVNGLFTFGEKDATAQENGVEFTIPGLTFGVDYRLDDQFVLGAALSYESFDGSFQPTPLTVSGGSLESDRLNFSLYTTFYTDRFYVDGIFSVGANDYEMTRTIVFPGLSRSARADTNGDQYEFTAAWGHTGNAGFFHYNPHVRVSLLNLDIDGYTEIGAAGLNVTADRQRIDSLLFAAGADFSWTVSTARGVLVPQIRGEWSHELEDDARVMTARFSNDPTQQMFRIPTDSPDRDYVVLGAGLSAVFQGGTQAFLDLEGVLGLRDVASCSVTIGVRFEL